jgi:hypothetical protein
MPDVHGNTCYGRQEIADVFAGFYADLFNAKVVGVDAPDLRHLPTELVPALTADEVRRALRNMAKRKSGDSSGIVVEI